MSRATVAAGPQRENGGVVYLLQPSTDVTPFLKFDVDQSPVTSGAEAGS